MINEIKVSRDSRSAGVSVVIEVETYYDDDSKREARRVLKVATQEALVLLGEEVEK